MDTVASIEARRKRVEEAAAAHLFGEVPTCGHCSDRTEGLLKMLAIVSGCDQLNIVNEGARWSG